MLYKTEKVGDEIFHEGSLAQKLGLEVEFLTKEDIAKLETGTKTDAIGAVHYKSDAHLYPQKFIAFFGGGAVFNTFLGTSSFLKKNKLSQDL